MDLNESIKNLDKFKLNPGLALHHYDKEPNWRPESIPAPFVDDYKPTKLSYINSEPFVEFEYEGDIWAQKLPNEQL